MDIFWYGQSCVRIRGKNASVVFDPFDPQFVGFKAPKISADIVTVSHAHQDHNNVDLVTGATEGQSPFVISGPGEYGVLGVSVFGISTFHDKKNGAERGRNTLYQITIDGITFLHCGDLGHRLTDEYLRELADIDVLFIPVGGGYTIDGVEAAEVVAELEPSIVIPIHYRVEGLKFPLDPVDKFLKAVGSENVAAVAKLTISKDKLPEETQVVVLEKQ